MPLPPPNITSEPRSEDPAWRPSEAAGAGGFLRHLCASWTWRMAWRDSRTSRRRLLLFSISISLGIAALIAIGLFRASLAQAIDDQSRSLLGADFVVESSRPFTPEQEHILRSLGQTQAREVRFR